MTVPRQEVSARPLGPQLLGTIGMYPAGHLVPDSELGAVVVVYHPFSKAGAGKYEAVGWSGGGKLAQGEIFPLEAGLVGCLFKGNC